jgi:hypothetical protein
MSIEHQSLQQRARLSPSRVSFQLFSSINPATTVVTVKGRTRIFANFRSYPTLHIRDQSSCTPRCRMARTAGKILRQADA